MTSKIRQILWIDDEAIRQQDADNLSDRGLRVYFERPNALFDAPQRLKQFDLLLIDYRLDRGPVAEHFSGKGPAIAGLLRSESDVIPAYLVTKENFAELSGLTAFEEVLSLNALIVDVSRARAKLKNDIDAYRAIRRIEPGPKAVDELLALLKVPVGSKALVQEALPMSLQVMWKGDTSAGAPAVETTSAGVLNFARWVRRTLLSRPGPLKDGLRSATRLGLLEARFTASPVFRSCRYSGIFEDLQVEHWWTACLEEKIFALARKKKVGERVPWVLGTHLFRIEKKNLLKCAVCGDPFPDTVARETGTQSFRPVHIRCSRPDPERDLVPFFDEERVYGKGP